MTIASSDPVLIEARGKITEITLNRPTKKNALTSAMYAALGHAFRKAAEDNGTRVVVITGSGNAFSAGNDIQDFRDAPPLDLEAPLYQFLRALSECPKIVIGAVEGVAAGIGTTMLFHCDLVVAATSARFLLPFVNLGLVPEAASSMLLPQLMGRRLANMHFLLARPLDATRALQYGLVSEVVADGSALETAREMAQAICAKAPNAVRLTKALLSAPAESINDRIAREARAYVQQLQSAETAEAFSAFVAKRPPSFT